LAAGRSLSALRIIGGPDTHQVGLTPKETKMKKTLLAIALMLFVALAEGTTLPSIAVCNCM
jgi:hypothetical protein